MTVHRASASQASVTSDELPPGTLLRDTFEVLELVGEGGAGAVYLAQHVKLGHLVALKQLFPSLARKSSIRERFINEGRIQALMNHPNVVKVHDIIDDGSICAIVMEYIDGLSLDKYIHRTSDLPVPREVAAVFLPILEGMQYAHEQGIVHRDIKPGNVMLAETPRGVVPKIADFGIAKIVSDVGLTRTGTRMGTLYYMAPEQFVDAKTVDERADIYSLGCTLYELLTRRLPFEIHNEYGLMKAHLEAAPPSPRDYNPRVARELVDVVECALAKEPDDRFATCAAFAVALREACDITSQTGKDGAAPIALIQGARFTGSGVARRVTVSQAAGSVAQRRPTTSGSTPRRPATSGSTPNRRATSGSNPREGLAITPTHSQLAIPADDPQTEQRPGWIWGAIVGAVLAVALVGVGIAVGNGWIGAGADTDDSTPIQSAAAITGGVAEPSVDGAPAVGSPGSGETTEEGSAEVADAATEAADNRVTRLQECRSLDDAYWAVDGDGEALSEGIRRLDEAQRDCRGVLVDHAQHSPYDLLLAQITADTIRASLHRLLAVQAIGREESDPCNDVLIVSTELQRLLGRIRRAVDSGELQPFEVASIEPRQREAAARLDALRTAFPTCPIEAIPEELLQER